MNILNCRSSTSLANVVVQQLRSNAHELSKEPGIKAFCSALAAELANVQHRLEELIDVSSNTAEERRVLKLLDNLERLCQWPTRFSAPTPLGDTIDRRRYPILIRILAKKQFVKKVMKDFAADPRAKKDRESLIKLLKVFGRPKKTVLGPELFQLEPGKTQQQQDDYQAYIRALYSNLASHCICLRQDGQKEIMANLRLKGCCSPGKLEDSASFRLFFLDHPHHHDSSGSCQWQDTQISVLRKREIKLKTEEAASSSTRSSRVILMGTFCEIITNRKRSQLKLAVSDDGLILQGPGPLSHGFLLNASSVSLAKLLNTAKLSRKMKLLLSYFLAKAVWQFYDSEWMQQEWTKETVHFMFERRSETSKGIFMDDPFLCTRFDNAHPGQDKDDEFRSHIFPKILALGVMFLEIELGIDIKDYRMPEDLGPDGEPTVNADHIAAIELFNKTEWDEMETFGAFRDVIGACLTPDDFKPFLSDTQGLRDAFQKRVVNPLHILYKTAWDNPDTSHVRAIKADISKQSPLEINDGVVHPASPLPVPSAAPICQIPCCLPALHLPTRMHSHSFRHSVQCGVSPSLSPLPDSVMSTSTRSYSSDDWFQELDKLNSVLRAKPKEKDRLYRPAKIAILDTGVSEDFAEYIKGYKDFVDQMDDDLRDNTGHGTNAVRLIQKVYNMADIYVGRVFEGSNASTNTADLMAEAIRHAKDTWKVDIIVLSSGFKSEHRNMEIAIDDVRNAHILVFAASSNYGNVYDIAFPGRLYRGLKLMCMFSTDPNARALPHYNPSVLPDARYSFAILGENILLPHAEKPMSGTSFATIIGAAVAGRILDFSRHRENRESIRRAEKLNTVEGMSAVFARMVKGTVDNGYHCMAPWKILPPGNPGEDQIKKRLRERADVCETISRALEDTHGR